jgi:hypothetical protein
MGFGDGFYFCPVTAGFCLNVGKIFIVKIAFKNIDLFLGKDISFPGWQNNVIPRACSLYGGYSILYFPARVSA